LIRSDRMEVAVEVGEVGFDAQRLS